MYLNRLASENEPKSVVMDHTWLGCKVTKQILFAALFLFRVREHLQKSSFHYEPILIKYQVSSKS